MGLPRLGIVVLAAWPPSVCTPQEPDDPVGLTLEVEPDQATYRPGTSVTVTAVPVDLPAEAAPYFRWRLDDPESDPLPGTDAERTLVLDQTTTVHVTMLDDLHLFEHHASELLVVSELGPLGSLRVTVDDGGGEIVLPDDTRCADACDHDAALGSTVQIEAVPFPDHQFVSWLGCATSSEPILDVAIDAAEVHCTAVFASDGPDCTEPLEVTLEVVDPVDFCSDTTKLYGTDWPTVEVATFEATVRAATSHGSSGIRWAVPLQDPRAPDFESAIVTEQELSLFTGTTSGAAVEITDTCDPPRTEQAVLLVRQGDGKCP